MRPPTVIEPGRLIAGRHPCAVSPDEAADDVRRLVHEGVTLFVDLTHEGELEPYAAHVEPPTRYLSRPIRDFSVPTGTRRNTSSAPLPYLSAPRPFPPLFARWMRA